MKFDEQLLDDVMGWLIVEQRTLADLKQKRADHPEAAGTLDPLIEKFTEMSGYLEKSMTELRMSVVASLNAKPEEP